MYRHTQASLLGDARVRVRARARARVRVGVRVRIRVRVRVRAGEEGARAWHEAGEG